MTFRNLHEPSVFPAMAVTINQHPSLTAKQRQAALMLASGASKKSTAETLKLAAHTISQWCKSPSFNDAVNQHLASVEGEAVQVLRAQKLRALDTLTSLMDEQNPPQVRLSAAQAALALPTPPEPAPVPARSPEQVAHDDLCAALTWARDELIAEGHLPPEPTHAATRHH